jgi:hypothetical protein
MRRTVLALVAIGVALFIAAATHDKNFGVWWLVLAVGIYFVMDYVAERVMGIDPHGQSFIGRLTTKG